MFSRLCLLWEAVHPIRGIAPLLIGCTATDRVYRNGTGAALHGRALLGADMCSVSEETRVRGCYR